jgi:hypothetical protein
MQSVTFPTARHSAITWRLTCGSEVSEVISASEFPWPCGALAALSRIDTRPHFAASDRHR